MLPQTPECKCSWSRSEFSLGFEGTDQIFDIHLPGRPHYQSKNTGVTSSCGFAPCSVSLSHYTACNNRSQCQAGNGGLKLGSTSLRVLPGNCPATSHRTELAENIVLVGHVLDENGIFQRKLCGLIVLSPPCRPICTLSCSIA